MAERIFAPDALNLQDTGCDTAFITEPAGRVRHLAEDHRRAYGNLELLVGRTVPAFDAVATALTPPVGVVAGGFSPSALSVCVEFAAHLRVVRGWDVHLLSTTRIEGDGAIAFPHFVVVGTAATTAVDVVLWEVMPRQRLARLGLKEPTVSWWHDRLDRLALLRQAARRGAVPEVLAEAMAERYLSFRFVCEHDELLRQVIMGDDEGGAV